MSTSLKARFRFTEEFDIHLAREVYGQNPFENPKRWATIQVNMIQITGKCVSIRTLRERIENLAKKYLAKSQSLQGKSGIEILTTEIDDLLQQITELMAEFGKGKKGKSTAVVSGSKSSYLQGYDAREESCTFTKYDTQSNDFMQVESSDQPQNLLECMEEVEIENPVTEEIMLPIIRVTGTPGRKRPLAQANIITPTRKRGNMNVKQNTVQYLERKNQKQYETRCRELHLQERRQSLEEKKFELDKEERLRRLELEEKRFEMEQKRLKVELDLFANQQEIIKMLFKKNT